MARLSSTDVGGRTRRACATLRHLPARIWLAAEGWRERMQLRRELDHLRQHGELERTLRDSGIAPTDIYRLMRAHPRTCEQLDDMMQRLGIARDALPRSPAVAEGLRAMEWRCGECADWRKCRRWLDAADAPGSYRAFCPNAEALDELRMAGESFGKPRGVLTELAVAANSEHATKATVRS